MPDPETADGVGETAEAASGSALAALEEARRYAERGGGYDTPLLEHRIQTRPPEEVIVGGEPRSKRHTSAVMRTEQVFNHRTGKHEGRQVMEQRTEYAYEQCVRVWHPERVELIEGGPFGPCVISHGWYTLYRAWVWSPHPTLAATAKHVKRRSEELAARLRERPDEGPWVFPKETEGPPDPEEGREPDPEPTGLHQSS